MVFQQWEPPDGLITIEHPYERTSEELRALGEITTDGSRLARRLGRVL